MKRLRLLAAGVIVTILSAVAAAAQQPIDTSILVTPVVGFNGLTKSNHWVPVRLEVQNSGTSVRGTLAVSVDRSDRIGPLQQRVEIERPLDLAAGTVKAFEVILPLTSSVFPVKVTITADGEQMPMYESEIDLTGRSTRGALVVALSRRTNLDFLMARLNQVNDRTIDIAYPIPEYMPRSWIGLDAVDVVVIHDARLEDLELSQWRALRLWTANGGTIVVSGGNHLADGDLRLLASFLNEGVAVGAETGESNVIEIGSGRVVLLPFDYVEYHRALPERSLQLWTTLVSERERLQQLPITERRRVFENELLADILAFPTFSFPSNLSLIGLILVYLLAAATVGYAAYVRRYRPAWRFVAAAVIVVAAATTLGALALGRSLHPDRALQVSLEQARITAGSSHARVDHDIVLFSRSASTYEVSFGSGPAPIPLEGEDLTIAYDAETVSVSMQVQRWGHRNVWLREVTSFPIDGSVTRADGRLLVSLDNQTPVTLQQAVVLFQGTPQPLGSVPPGERISAELSASADGDLDEVDWERLVPGGTVRAQQAQILESYARRQRFETNGTDQLVVIAWLASPLIPVTTDPASGRAVAINMIVIAYPYEVWS